MAKTSPAEFVRQVRREVGKVVWPTRKEIMLSTIMVMVMVSVAAVFFLMVDNLIAFSVRAVLGLGS